MELLELAKKGDLSSLKDMIAKADSPSLINSKDLQYFTILHIAAKYGYCDIAQYALSFTIDIDTTNVSGDTALTLAAQGGHFDILKTLMECGAQVNHANDHGNTALHYTCFWDHKECTQYLIYECDALLNVENRYGRRAVDRASAFIKEALDKAMSKQQQDGNKEIRAPLRTGRSLIEAQIENKQRFMSKAGSQHFDVPLSSILMDRPFVKTYRCDTRKAILHAKDVVVKRLKKQTVTPGDIKILKDEITSIRSHAHKNLEMIMAACFASQNVSIITEYEAAGNLYSTLRNAELDMDPFTTMRICKGICEGMQFLHKNRMNHYNLKSKNVLLSQDLSPRLTDYGFKESVFKSIPKLACDTTEGEKRPPPALFYDAAWLAPELLQAYMPGASKSDLDFNKIDAYAYGILFCEIITRQDSYPGLNSMAIGVLVVDEGMRPDIPEFVPDALYEIAVSCWDDIPSERPSFDQTLDNIDAFIAEFSSPAVDLEQDASPQAEQTLPVKATATPEGNKSPGPIRSKPLKSSPLAVSMTAATRDEDVDNDILASGAEKLANVAVKEILNGGVVIANEDRAIVHGYQSLKPAPMDNISPTKAKPIAVITSHLGVRMESSLSPMRIDPTNVAHFLSLSGKEKQSSYSSVYSSEPKSATSGSFSVKDIFVNTPISTNFRDDDSDEECFYRADSSSSDEDGSLLFSSQIASVVGREGAENFSYTPTISNLQDEENVIRDSAASGVAPLSSFHQKNTALQSARESVSSKGSSNSRLKSSSIASLTSRHATRDDDDEISQVASSVSPSGTLGPTKTSASANQAWSTLQRGGLRSTNSEFPAAAITSSPSNRSIAATESMDRNRPLVASNSPTYRASVVTTMTVALGSTGGLDQSSGRKETIPYDSPQPGGSEEVDREPTSFSSTTSSISTTSAEPIVSVRKTSATSRMNRMAEALPALPKVETLPSPSKEVATLDDLDNLDALLNEALDFGVE